MPASTPAYTVFKLAETDAPYNLCRTGTARLTASVGHAWGGKLETDAFLHALPFKMRDKFDELIAVTKLDDSATRRDKLLKRAVDVIALIEVIGRNTPEARSSSHKASTPAKIATEWQALAKASSGLSQSQVCTFMRALSLPTNLTLADIIESHDYGVSWHEILVSHQKQVAKLGVFEGMYLTRIALPDGDTELHARFTLPKWVKDADQSIDPATALFTNLAA